MAVLGRGPDVADARAPRADRSAVPVYREKSAGLGSFIRNASGQKDGFEFERRRRRQRRESREAARPFAEAAARFGDENEWAAIVAGVMDDERGEREEDDESEKDGTEDSERASRGGRGREKGGFSSSRSSAIDRDTRDRNAGIFPSSRRAASPVPHVQVERLARPDVRGASAPNTGAPGSSKLASDPDTFRSRRQSPPSERLRANPAALAVGRERRARESAGP